MKNLIVTFQNELNYGAVLQAYALQRYLNNEEGNTDICNISFHLGASRSFFERAATAIKTIKFNRFNRRYLPLTEKIGSMSDFCGILWRYDNVITGSDQVFALDILGGYKALFYLDVDCKNKYSYAASFGNNNILLENMEEIKKYLKSFKRISIREKSSSKILLENGIENSLCIDPTFLMSDVQYVEDFNLKKKKNDYILVYMPTIDTEAIEAVNKIKKYTGLRVVCFNNRNRFGKGTTCAPNASPIEFLEYYYNAKYVVSDSFHGTCFSIIFGKPFIAILNKGKAERQSELLKLIGLEDRIYDGAKDILSYTKPLGNRSKKAAEIIDESKKYLREVVEGS